MAEWLVEEGIGEERAVLLDRDGTAAARIRWPGGLECGEVAEGALAARDPDLVRCAGGEEAFVAQVPRRVAFGARVRLEIRREAMTERGRLKRAQGVYTDAPVAPAPTLAEALRAEGCPVRVVRRFPGEADWEELFLEAWAAETSYPGGTLLLSDTPAMTLIDVDAQRSREALAGAVPALARTLRRLDIGGNVGIDFPSLPGKADRRALDHALAAALEGWPHERTAMNGFGFVQLVSRMSRPSVLQRLARDRAGAAARILLRRAEAVAEPGTLLLAAHPAVAARLDEAWLAELARRTGRWLRVEPDAGLALEAGFAQALAA